MIILDENISYSQRAILDSWKIKVRQIGVELEYKGISDKNIITKMKKLRFPTLITRDRGFYNRYYLSQDYCIAVMGVEKEEVASFLRRFLQLDPFNTKKKRMGHVISISHGTLKFYTKSSNSEETHSW